MLRAVGVLGWCLLLGSGGNVGGAAPGCVWWGRCDTVLSPASLGPTPTGLQLKLGWVGERKILRVAKSSSSRKQSGWFPLKTETRSNCSPQNFSLLRLICFGKFGLFASANLPCFGFSLVSAIFEAALYRKTPQNTATKARPRGDSFLGLLPPRLARLRCGKSRC